MSSTKNELMLVSPFKIPIEELVEKRKAVLIKNLVAYYLNDIGKDFDPSNSVNEILYDRKKSKELTQFFTKHTKIKNKKLLFDSLVSLSELYNAVGSHNNSILFWKAAYKLAANLSQRKMIRLRLLDSTQKHAMNLISSNKIKEAEEIIFEHIIFIVSTHNYRFARINENDIKSLMMSPVIASQILTKANKTLKKKPNPVLQSIAEKIRKTKQGYN